MELIKSLLAVSNAKNLSENDDEDRDMTELVELLCDKMKWYHFEGSGGVNDFTKFVKILGYGDIEDFLADNSGATNAMVEWIQTVNSPEWKASIEEALGDEV